MAVKYQSGDEPIEGYRLQHYLGKGTFGSVWKATAPGGTEVAMKFIDLSDQHGFRELKALQLIKRLRHPNIVPLMGFWLKDEFGHVVDQDELVDTSAIDTLCASTIGSGMNAVELIVVMGLGDQSLFDRLKEVQADGHLGIAAHELLKYMEDIGRAIDFLNGKEASGTDSQDRLGMQHCDIKPQNILLVGGAAQLCDLGLVRLSDESRSTRMSFTAAYGAPECFQGTTPSSSTDQYSLAISYIELRTGSLPFDDLSSPASVIQQHLASELDLSQLSSLEQQVIRRATEQDPTKRYPSTLEFVNDLKAAVAGSLPVEHNNNKKQSKQWRWWLALSASLAASAALSLGLLPQATRSNLLTPLGYQPAKVDDSSRQATVRTAIDSSSEVDRNDATNELVDATVKTSDDSAASTLPVTRSEPTSDSPISEVRESFPAKPNGESHTESELPVSPDALKEPATESEVQSRVSSRWINDRWLEFTSQLERGQDVLTSIASNAPLSVNVDPLRRWASNLEAKFAARALKSRDLKRAETHVKRALELHSAVPTAHLQAGRLMARHGELDAAIERYGLAIELDPKLQLAHRLRGIAFAIQGEVTRAQPDLTEALRLDPNDANALRIRALVRLELGRYESAVQDRLRLSMLSGQRRGLVLPLQLVQATKVKTESGEIDLPPNYPMTLVTTDGRNLTVDFIYEQERHTTTILSSRVRPNAKL